MIFNNILHIIFNNILYNDYQLRIEFNNILYIIINYGLSLNNKKNQIILPISGINNPT
jgi:hypothetical protein